MSRSRRLGCKAFCALMLPLSGCGAPLRLADVRLPSRFEAAPAASADRAVLDRWWMQFGDPQLTAMVEAALGSAPDVRIALAQLQEAAANRRISLAQYEPQGAIGASAVTQDSTPTLTGIGGTLPVAGSSRTTTYSAGFSPSWELGLFGRAAALRKSANADFDTARFDFEATQQSLAANVATDLFNARGIAVQLDEARETERIAQELAKIGRLRVTVGIGARADSASLDADLAQAIANRQQLEAELSVAKRTLLLLLGRGTEPLASLVIEARLGTPPEIPFTAPGSLLGRRPDVREAQARVRSAAGKLRLDQLALLPSFSLAPSATATRIAGSSGYTTSLWSIGASLALPVLDRARLLAEIHGQRARGEQLVIAYERSVQTAYTEAESTFTTFAADRDRLIALTRAEERARYAFEAQRAGYRAGIVDLTTMLTAERTWRSAREQLSSVRTATLVDAVSTFKALGGGWSPDNLAQTPSLARELP